MRRFQKFLEAFFAYDNRSRERVSEGQSFQTTLNRLGWQDWTLFLFAVVLVWTVFSHFAPLGVDPHHDGIMLKPAMDLLAGQTLFRDTFMQYGPVPPYIHAFFLWIGGPTLLTLKYGNVLLYALAIPIFLASWRLILPRSLILLALAAWIMLAPFLRPFWVMLPWSSVVGLVFQSSACLFLVLWVAKPQRRHHLIFTGLAVSAFTLCRWTPGITLFLALSVAFIILAVQQEVPGTPNRSSVIPALKKCLSPFVFGFSAGLIVFLAQLLATHSLADWFRQTVLFPRQWLQSMPDSTGGKLIHSLFPWFHHGITIFLLMLVLLLPWCRQDGGQPFGRRFRWIYPSVAIGLFTFYFWNAVKNPNFRELTCGWATPIPLFLILGFLLFVVRILKPTRFQKLAPKQLAAFLLITVGLASWIQYFPVVCFRHVYWGIMPAFGAFLFVLYRLSGERIWVCAPLLALLLSPMAVSRIKGIQRTLDMPCVELQSPPSLKGMRATPHVAKVIIPLAGALENYFNTHPVKPILLEGDDALYATFTKDLSNPGPLFVNWSFLSSNLKEQRRQFLTARRPVIVIQDATFEKVDEFINSSNYEILVRVESPPEESVPGKNKGPYVVLVPRGDQMKFTTVTNRLLNPPVRDEYRSCPNPRPPAPHVDQLFK